MKGVNKLAVVAVALIGVMRAQMPPHAKNPTSQKHAIALATILSCADDSMIDSVFKTDELTARGKLSALRSVAAREADPDYITLMAKGFEMTFVDDRQAYVFPVDLISGKPIARSSLPFCHNMPTATYGESTDYGKAFPVNVVINGEDWSLNANEIFVHADQFEFSSGTFTNSFDVYLMATKGRVSIQFMCRPSGLEFYRAFYTAGD